MRKIRPLIITALLASTIALPVPAVATSEECVTATERSSVRVDDRRRRVERLFDQTGVPSYGTWHELARGGYVDGILRRYRMCDGRPVHVLFLHEMGARNGWRVGDVSGVPAVYAARPDDDALDLALLAGAGPWATWSAS